MEVMSELGDGFDGDGCCDLEADEIPKECFGEPFPKAEEEHHYFSVEVDCCMVVVVAVGEEEVQ